MENQRFSVPLISGLKFRLRNILSSLENNDALIYVVDSSDRLRFQEAREELDRMLQEDSLSRTPVLILANKQDLPGAATCSEITQAFEMHKRQERQWYIQVES